MVDCEISLSASGKGKPVGRGARRSLLKDGDVMPDRDGSPSNAKRLKPNEQSFGALSASFFPSPPRSPAPVSSPLNSRKDAVNQSPGGNRSAAKGPGERAPDVIFETYTEYTSRGKPVPRDVVLAAVAKLQKDIRVSAM